MVTEFRGFSTNLGLLKASRKRQRPGDVFIMRIAGDNYLFGRVVRNDALWALADPDCRDDDATANLVYIHDHVTPVPELPEVTSLSRDRLLVPPLFVDGLWWARGYFQTVTNIALSSGDVLPQHCFLRLSDGRYYDEYNNVLAGPVEPVGRLSLPNIASVDTKISRALGIPEVG